jgi:hypothetical protein
MTGSGRTRLRSWSAAWSDVWGTLAPPCGYGECVHAQNWRGRMRHRSGGIRMQGVRYCRAECLELALVEVLGQARRVSRRAEITSHRIPLGLLLLSRQHITAVQLRTALEAQRAAGGGKTGIEMKIGAWLQHLGFVTEHQVTAALARQWSCPVLRTGARAIGASPFPPIPLLLLESFQMMPVEFVAPSGTLLMAFSEGIDYTVLYAVDQMLGYRTEPCLVCPSTLQKGLQARARHRESGEVVFDRVEDAGECARIIASYTTKVGAAEIRLARCGEHLWIRLKRLRQDVVTLVMRAPSSPQ